MGFLVLVLLASGIGEIYIRITQGVWINFYVSRDNVPIGFVFLAMSTVFVSVCACFAYLPILKKKYLLIKDDDNVTTFGLVSGYLSAVKNKMCPIIEYTDIK